MRRYGGEGLRLWRLARGIDERPVDAGRETKSVSAETTFERDIADFRPLERHLWELTEGVSTRLKAKKLAGSTVTLKLKTRGLQDPHPGAVARPPDAACQPDFLRRPRAARRAKSTAPNTACIGIGVSALEAAQAMPIDVDLIDRRAAEAEHAIDRLRGSSGAARRGEGLGASTAERRGR